jgi:hypothetical protein
MVDPRPCAEFIEDDQTRLVSVNSMSKWRSIRIEFTEEDHSWLVSVNSVK